MRWETGPGGWQARVLALVTPREAYVIFGLLVLGLLRLRIVLWWVITDDTKTSFLPWLNTIQTHGGFHALRAPIGDYFPFYFTLLAATSYLGRFLTPLGQVKLIPLVFDVVSAVLTWRIVAFVTRGRAGNTLLPAFGFLAVFALPTFLVDGALWGQCDSYLIAWELGVLYYLLRDQPVRALVCFGLALALKIQVLFMVPLLLVALLRGRMKWWQLPVVPAIWLLCLLPSVAAGRPIRGALDVFSAQTESFPVLAINVANWWELLQEGGFPYRAGVLLGLVAAAAAVGVLSWVGWRAKRFEGTWMLFFAAATLLMVPWFLPKMHDRYLLSGSVFLVVLAVCDMRFLLPAVMMEVSNMLVFSSYFRQRTTRVSTDLSILLCVAALGILAREMMRTWRAGELGEDTDEAGSTVVL